MAAIVGPMILAYLLIASDMRTDLSQTRAKGRNTGEGVALVGWADLESRTWTVGRVRMLGYMMDGYQRVPDGAPVSMFILMAEAGQLMHPAHRTPEEMVEVRLGPDQTILYEDRKLVWVEGILGHIRKDARTGAASWVLSEAYVQNAGQRDIGRWFKP